MRPSPLALSVLLVALAPSVEGQPADKIALAKIKYSDLGKYVRGFTGRVVVVDFWAEY